MKRDPGIGVVLVCLLAMTALGLAGHHKKFELTTESAQAKELLADVQARIENFQFGPQLADRARELVAADPNFALGMYYLSAVTPPQENQQYLDKAVELAKQASEGERRLIETMAMVRANNGANFQEGIPDLEKLAEDYPDERLVFIILGQLYQGTNDGEKAQAAFRKAQAIGPKSNRVRSFLANYDLLKGRYQQARDAFQAIEKDLPEGSAPFVIRYGTAFSYLYEENTQAAVSALEKYLTEYRDSGAAQSFPEVFIWNSIGRINLEGGRLDAAMKAYEKGYESVPESNLPEDQKKLWLGRLVHGRCRVLARMGKHDEAWAEAEAVKKMIEEGGEDAEQYLPAYHYLVGYLKLEKGDHATAIEHLEKGDLTDPFQQLLVARAYEGMGEKEKAREAYQEVVKSTNGGIERALAFPEASRKLSTL